MEVNRAEFYPNYNRFDTLTGAPAFFPTPEGEILTQIGGSTVRIPLPTIKGSLRLCFDVSWMYGMGDGGWAEARIRVGDNDIPVYRNYFKPDPNARSLAWKEVRFDLPEIGNRGAELVLRCYNDPGKNTAADWLNWRDITIEARK
jgi:hypothetical protein